MPVTNKLVDSEGKLSVVNVDVVECMILRLLLMTQLSDMASRMVLENTRLNTTTKFERAVVCTLTFFVNNGFQADVSTAALDLQCCGPNGENEIQQSWNSVHCFIVFVPDSVERAVYYVRCRNQSYKLKISHDEEILTLSLKVSRIQIVFI